MSVSRVSCICRKPTGARFNNLFPMFKRPSLIALTTSDEPGIWKAMYALPSGCSTMKASIASCCSFSMLTSCFDIAVRIVGCLDDDVINVAMHNIIRTAMHVTLIQLMSHLRHNHKSRQSLCRVTRQTLISKGWSFSFAERIINK